jgi:hypothetical protein
MNLFVESLGNQCRDDDETRVYLLEILTVVLSNKNCGGSPRLFTLRRQSPIQGETCDGFHSFRNAGGS